MLSWILTSSLILCSVTPSYAPFLGKLRDHFIDFITNRIKSVVTASLHLINSKSSWSDIGLAPTVCLGSRIIPSFVTFRFFSQIDFHCRFVCFRTISLSALNISKKPTVCDVLFFSTFVDYIEAISSLCHDYGVLTCVKLCRTELEEGDGITEGSGLQKSTIESRRESDPFKARRRNRFNVSQRQNLPIPPGARPEAPLPPPPRRTQYEYEGGRFTISIAITKTHHAH